MKTEYQQRLLLDYEFVKDVAIGNTFDSRQKSDILTGLMHIKASSSIHKGDHTVILDSQFIKIKEDRIMTEEEIRKIAKPLPLPDEFADWKDKTLEANIVMAIILTNESPWSCVILTSLKGEEAYSSNKHFNGLKDIEARSGDNAHALIKLMLGRRESSKN